MQALNIYQSFKKEFSSLKIKKNNQKLFCLKKKLDKVGLELGDKFCQSS